MYRFDSQIPSFCQVFVFDFFILGRKSMPVLTQRIAISILLSTQEPVKIKSNSKY